MFPPKKSDPNQSSGPAPTPGSDDHTPNPAHGAPPSQAQKDQMAQHGGKMNPDHRNHGDGHH